MTRAKSGHTTVHSHPAGRICVDKRLTIATLITLAFNFGVIVWQASAVNVRVSLMETNVSSLIRDRDRLIQSETRLGEVITRLDRIENKVDTITPSRRR